VHFREYLGFLYRVLHESHLIEPRDSYGVFLHPNSRFNECIRIGRIYFSDNDISSSDKLYEIMYVGIVPGAVHPKRRGLARINRLDPPTDEIVLRYLREENLFQKSREDIWTTIPFP
jgi:hypothetical protein